jgi:hypothetical protein
MNDNNSKNYDPYEVKSFETNKDTSNRKKIRCCEIGIFPKRLEQLGCLMVGRTGQGKSNLLQHILTSDKLLKDAFDPKHIFLYSACKPDKNLIKNLKLKKSNVKSDWNEEDVKKHLDMIEKVVDHKGFDNAPNTLFIFDDVLQKKKFLKSATMSNIASAHRHFKLTYFILSQFFRAIHCAIRSNASVLIYFSNNEMESNKLADEYTPPHMKKKRFLQLLHHATKEPYSFLMINTRAPYNEQLRKKFNTIIY